MSAATPSSVESDDRATPTPEVAPAADPRVSEVIARWRAGLVELAGGSSLADIGLLGDAVIDLTAAHPSGVAQLFAGRPTRLSNLFREGASLPIARRRARAVVAGVSEHFQRFGVAPTYLAIGVATWSIPTESADSTVLTAVREHAPDGHIVRAPVLLRPLSVTPHGDGDADYDLFLEPTAEINPLLARTLRLRGALLDPAALARGTFTGSGFDPTETLDEVARLGRDVLGGFELTSQVLAGAFVHPGQILVDDLDELSPVLGSHELILSLAGVAPPVSASLPVPRAGDAEPEHERGVGDLNPSQRYVIDVLATGSHLFVDAPIGSDGTGTIAAAVAEAAASGLSILYVPGHRRAADALVNRLESLGLGGLVLDVAPEATWRQSASHRLLSAMAVEAEQVDEEATGKARIALLESRAELSGYIEALHLVREPWGASAYDALQALARLTAERSGPSTAVRLHRDVVLAATAENRERLAGDLTRVATLGAFTQHNARSPWYGANLTADEAAFEAVTRIERLRDQALPQLLAHVVEVARVTGLTPAVTLRQWAEQLTMLGGMRDTLNYFQPMVFENSPRPMIEATAAKQWRDEHGVDMSVMLRRRLQRRAKDMLRPGQRVTDMHSFLLRIEEQRAVWQAECPGGGWPVLPEGLPRIEETYRSVRQDLESLDPILVTEPSASLLDTPFELLDDQLGALADAKNDLADLPTRTVLLRRLEAAGLGELVADLVAREVETELVGPELELAWWSSVFEQILEGEETLNSQDGAGLELLAQRFRALDRTHVDSLAVGVRVAVREHLTTAMRHFGPEADALFTELIEGRLASLRDIAIRFPNIERRLRPVLIATPTLVPHLVAPERVIDLVVIDAIEHTPIELVISALARGKQVLVVGDQRVASRDAVATVRPVLPVVTLSAESSVRDPALTAFLAEHGYQGVLRPAPVPRVEPRVTFDLVEGVGMPDAESGAVASSQVEIDRVVQMAIDHATDRSDESFAVVTASSVHAERLRTALGAEVRRHPALAEYFAGSRPEPVVVADLASTAGLTRDTVVFSVGFGRTPHGRVLHRFGALNGPGGDAMLLDALGAARRRLHVVSSFGAADLDHERLRGPGAKLLAEVLDLAEHCHDPRATGAVASDSNLDSSQDRLLLDLAERLWRAGLSVETSYGLGDGDRIPLVVGHPDIPGELLVAVLTDDDAYIAEPSIRVRDRQLAERLERLGWVVTQVWSAAVFLDPAAEADRIRRLVQAVRDRRLEGTGGRG